VSGSTIPVRRSPAQWAARAGTPLDLGDGGKIKGAVALPRQLR
jgi:hypothetical protein